MPTELDDEILDYIQTYQRAHGMPPSTRDVQRQFNFASQTSAMRRLRSLADKGLLEQQVDRSWGVRVREVQAHLFELPVYGTIPAGLPSLQEQEPKRRYALDPALFGLKRPQKLWGLEVRGDSMIETHILDGDLAILETREARPGDIVAALVDETTTTLKRLVHVRGKPVLRAANRRFADIIPETRLEIQGVLVGVIRRHA